MNGSICQEKHNLVRLRPLSRLKKSEKLGQKWCEEGWATKTNLRQRLPISHYDLLDALDRWVYHVSIHSETVVDSVDAEVAWNASESKNWEQLVKVVGLNNLAHVKNCAFVLVALAHGVQ